MVKWLMLVISLISAMAFGSVETDAFQDAVMKNDVAAVKVMMGKGFNSNQNLNDVGETPLTLVALNGRAEILEAISSPQKLDVNHQTDGGWTALMFAARAQSYGHKGQKRTETKEYIKTVDLLLKMGADRNLKNKHGQDALKIAQISKNKEIEKLLKSK